MAALKLQVIYVVTLCICINADNLLNQEQESRDNEIERLRKEGMDEPELFYDLMHTKNFHRNCSHLNVTEICNKMKALYKLNITSNHKSDYNFMIDCSGFYGLYNDVYKLFSKSNFEDYFAFRRYVYYKSGTDVDEERRMKNAAYRQAIIQSSKANNICDNKLYLILKKPTMWYEKKFSIDKTEYELDDFTLGMQYLESESNYRSRRKRESTYTTAFFEFDLPNPYLCVNFHNLRQYSYRELYSYMLPETKFFINDTYWEDSTVIGLRIKLMQNDEKMTIFEQQKKVMRKLKELKESDTKFYIDC